MTQGLCLHLPACMTRRVNQAIGDIKPNKTQLIQRKLLTPKPDRICFGTASRRRGWTLRLERLLASKVLTTRMARWCLHLPACMTKRVNQAIGDIKPNKTQLIQRKLLTPKPDRICFGIAKTK